MRRFVEFATEEDRYATVDLDGVVAVSDHDPPATARLRGGCYCCLHFYGGSVLRLKESREDVVRLWTGQDTSPKALGVDSGIFDGHSRRHVTGAVLDERTEWPVPSGEIPADVHPLPETLAEDQQRFIEKRRLEREEERKRFDSIIEKIVTRESAKLSVLEFLRYLRETLTDDVLGKLESIGMPDYLRGIAHDLRWGRSSRFGPFPPEPLPPTDQESSPDEMIAEYAAWRAWYRELWARTLCQFYRNFPPFDVENTDPGTMPAIREAHVAVDGVLAKGNKAEPDQVEWAVGKAKTALRCIDRYFGRSNYERSEELAKFVLARQQES